MPLLLEIGRQWHSQRQSGDVSASLRQIMFQTVFKELITRASKLNLEKKRRRLDTGAESQRHFDRRPQMTIPDLQCRSKGPSAELENSIDIKGCMSDHAEDSPAGSESESGVEIHRSSFVKPGQLAPGPAIAIPWRLGLNLHGPETLELHTLLLKLAGNGITQLVLMRVRQVNLQRSPLAVAMSQRLRRS